MPKKFKRLPLLKRPFLASRIIEIGGGHEPYAGVTHAVDKYPEDNTQRAGALVVSDGVEFKVGDLEAIPFEAEPKFDFLYASHVLEHVRNPGQAIAEINRVSRRGYIETPSPLREQIACPMPYDPADFHLLFVWTVRGQRNTIHVARKSAAVVGEFCDCGNGKLARKLFWMRREKGVDVEPLLPRSAKTTSLHYRAPVTLVEHGSLREACETGSCAYETAREVRRWTGTPLKIVSSRFGQLSRHLA